MPCAWANRRKQLDTPLIIVHLIKSPSSTEGQSKATLQLIHCRIHPKKKRQALGIS
jgi:hypothetical protein